MFESKFIFVGKIFLLAFLVINFPPFFPIRLFEVSYFFVITTTIFDTASLLVLSLAISKYIHAKNLKLVENFNTQNDINCRSLDNINLHENHIKNDNKISLIFAIMFAFLTLLQPLLLTFSVNKSDIYASNILNSINEEFKNQKKGIEELVIKGNSNEIKKIEKDKVDDRISQLTRIKDRNIQNFLNKNNRNKFENVKIIVRNIMLGILWTLCFIKIYKI